MYFRSKTKHLRARLFVATSLFALASIASSPLRSSATAARSAPAKPKTLPAAEPANLTDPDFLRWYDNLRSSSAARPQQDEPFATIDACVAQDMARVNAPGASIAIMLEGELVYTKGYGVKHADEGGEIDAETLFRIGSTSKMMTAAAVMQQVENGKLDLDAPLTDVLTDFAVAEPWDAGDMSLQQLLTHSAGIPDNLDGAYGPTTLAEWAAQQDHMQLYAPPGSFWNYSNPSWSLAGLAAQVASGKPYRDYLVDEVWRPAGMPLTTMNAAEVISTSNYAYGLASNGQSVPPDAYDSLWGGPAGFAFSTPTELVSWTKLLMDGGGAVLSEASAEAMQGRQIDLQNQPGVYYGYGIFRNEQLPGLTLLDHGGNIDGFSSQLYWVPERGFAVSILASSGSSLSNAARCAIFEVLEPELPEPQDLSTDPATWTRYKGAYVVQDRYGNQETAWIEATGEALIAHLGDGPVNMVQLGGDTFVEDGDGDGQGDGDSITFIADPELPERAQWARNRGFVGIRAGDIPMQVALEGSGCGSFAFTSHMSMPDLRVRAAGLDSEVETEVDIAIGQDDPDDPSSAGYKRGLRLDTPAGRLSVTVDGPVDEDLDLFLLYDADGDGGFVYPDELLTSSATSTADERISLGGLDEVPAGDYQIWVQGWRVDADDATFDLRIETLAGEALSLPAAPDSISLDEQVELEVCVDDGAMQGVDEDRMGLLVLSTGAAPRDILLPVAWTPGEPPAPKIFLPMALHVSELR